MTDTNTPSRKEQVSPSLVVDTALPWPDTEQRIYMRRRKIWRKSFMFNKIYLT